MIFGIARYRREQYGLLRVLATDPDAMGKTYEEWLAGATKTMVDLKQSGIRACKVDVDVNALAKWCEENGKPLDGKARSIYTLELVKSGKYEA